MNVQLCLDWEKFQRKPYNKRKHPDKPDEFGMINKRISMQVEEIEVDELARQVTSPNGRMWCGGYYMPSEHKTNDMWLGQQVFALDFDSGFSFEECQARCDEYGLEINFAYTTFTSIDRERFRVVFVLPVEVTNPRLHGLIQLALLKIFPEADQSCKDPARLITGGRDLIYENYDGILYPDKLIDALCLYIYRTSDKNASRDLQRFCKAVKISMVNGLPDMVVIDGDDPSEEYINNDDDGRFHVATYKYIIDPEVNSSRHLFFHFPTTLTPTDPVNGASVDLSNRVVKRDLIRMVNWGQLYNRCPLYRGFMDGTLLLDHHQLWGLATNLLCLMGGETKFFEGLSKRPEYNLDKWEAECQHISKRCYAPARYSTFYAEAEEVAQAINLVEAAKLKAGRIHVYEPPEYLTIKEAERKFDNTMQEIMNQPGDGMYVVRADTGIGKTHWYTRLRRICVAVVTHRLKGEVVPRFERNGIRAMATPRLPDDLDPEIAATMDKLYRTGSCMKANAVLRDMKYAYENVEEYLNELSAIERHTKEDVVVTTHERLLYLPVKQDTIIVDEDIMPTLLKQGTMSVDDFAHLCRLVRQPSSRVDQMDRQTLGSLLKFVEDAHDNILMTMPTFPMLKSINIEAHVAHHQISTNVIGFLSATHFIKSKGTVTFITRRDLPTGKKIIVLSASASEMMYRKFFGDRLKGFYDIGRVKPKGRLVQCPQRSFSRHRLKEQPELINIGVNIAGDRPVITFKCAAPYFKNVVATFGATAGLDAYAGKDIVVFGTPHLHPFVYLLYAKALGLTVGYGDTDVMSYQQVRRNGYEFRFQTYSNNPDLQELQLHLIEAELIQAVGRARILRNDCTVTVMASLPLTGADFIYLSFDEITKLSSIETSPDDIKTNTPEDSQHHHQCNGIQTPYPLSPTINTSLLFYPESIITDIAPSHEELAPGRS